MTSKAADLVCTLKYGYHSECWPIEIQRVVRVWQGCFSESGKVGTTSHRFVLSWARNL